MKKLFIASAVALFGMVQAQEDYKPAAGDVTVDLGVSGGLGNTTINLPNQSFGAGPMLKARYFTSDKFAYRATFTLGNSSNTDNSVTNVVTEDDNFGFGLGFGVEKHFTGTDRLSPYVGGDLMIAYNSSNDKTTTSIPSFPVNVVEVKGPNNFGFGVRGVFGADYYFAKRVFLGVEAGLGLMYQSEGDTTLKATGSPDVTVDGGSNFNISTSVVTGVRIGYAF